MTSRRRTDGLTRWAKSKAGRAPPRPVAQFDHKNHPAPARCGGHRRDGEPCTQPALSGRKRCRHHGGLTPAGKAWHVVQYPDASTPAGVVRFNRKLRQQQRYAKQRAARLAAMTPEQRAAHEAWHRARRPGLTKAARTVERERARQNADARRSIAQRPPEEPLSPEAARIREALAAAKAELARLEAKSKSKNDSEGIFG